MQTALLLLSGMVQTYAFPADAPPSLTPEVCRVSGRSGAHFFEARFSAGPFDVKGRKLGAIRFVNISPNYFPADGKRRLYGEEGWTKKEIHTVVFPRLKTYTQLTGLVVKMDGKVVPVPKRWYDDLLRPNVRAECIASHLSADGRRLFLTLGGSDGDAGYCAEWTIQKNGKIRRKIVFGP